MSNKNKSETIPAHLMEWARTVVRLLDFDKKDIKQTIKWWRSKKAKQLWGTDSARLHRDALKKILSESVQ